MIRGALVRLHRWAGLTAAAFLVVVGLTGSLLAFLPQLNRVFAPEVFARAATDAPALGFATLVQRAEARVASAAVSSIDLSTPGVAAVALEPRAPDAQIEVATVYLDAATGDELGRVSTATWPASHAEVMPFVYRLHTQLVAGDTGALVLGLIALLWTADCFFGLLLTAPRLHGMRGFFMRWARSFRIKRRAATFRVVFDIHRAGGLWLWSMLLLFAWSAVYMNLNGVYSRVTDVLFGYEQPVWARPIPPSRHETRDLLTWQQAEAAARQLMAAQARAGGFTVIRPTAFFAMRDRGLYEYSVQSTRDVGERFGRTTVDFDAYSGALVAVALPSGQFPGETLTTWLVELHMANVFGLPYRALVSALGTAVAILSFSGVYVWWRKRRARQVHRWRALGRADRGSSQG